MCGDARLKLSLVPIKCTSVRGRRGELSMLGQSTGKSKSRGKVSQEARIHNRNRGPVLDTAGSPPDTETADELH